jgi:hypothetical protein
LAISSPLSSTGMRARWLTTNAQMIKVIVIGAGVMGASSSVRRA